MRITFLIASILCGIIAHAQVLKTYSGEFDALGNNSLMGFGEATYTYYPGDDGRIFHGKFHYSDKRNSLQGSFVNNVQDGKWIYTTTERFRGKCTYTLNFNNGILDGLFSMVQTNIKTNAVVSKISCFFSDGKLVGPASGINAQLAVFGDLSKIKKNTFKGSFDEDGFPAGKWILQGNSRHWVENYINNDTCTVIYTNLSTGDKINPTYEYELSPKLANIIIKEVNTVLKIIRLRDTGQNNLTEFKFTTPTTTHEYTDGRVSCAVTTDDPFSNIFIIIYPHRYSDILPNVGGQDLQILQEIPQEALSPPKGYKPAK